ncbi:auxin-responsive protein SAUR71-like [Cornus florida]|uniref:auxin-responsive protein SAUR71-like n=1 Tax=Cornus florida TaxID=4283 RepID=UPI0028A149F5|nr:auxin-responsive protein SAUR71-like [Cornus florida]
MDLAKGKGKKGVIIRTLERCWSWDGGIGKSSSRIRRVLMMKNKSWPRIRAAPEEQKRGKKSRVAPEGCFSVYVGPQKQRFVIKTEYANHPLFKMLLEEAELEYGFNSEGPLELPCNVDLFYEVLMEMDHSEEIPKGCGFVKSHSSYNLLSPSRLVAMNQF